VLHWWQRVEQVLWCFVRTADFSAGVDTGPTEKEHCILGPNLSRRQLRSDCIYKPGLFRSAAAEKRDNDDINP